MIKKTKYFTTDFTSDEVISHIKRQLAIIRNNASKVVDETFVNINNLTKNRNENQDDRILFKSKNIDSSNRKYKNVELLNFLHYSNNKLSKYNIDLQNSNIINDYS